MKKILIILTLLTNLLTVYGYDNNFIKLNNGVTSYEEIIESTKKYQTLSKIFEKDEEYYDEISSLFDGIPYYNLDKEIYASKKEKLKDGNYSFIQRYNEDNSKYFFNIKNGKLNQVFSINNNYISYYGYEKIEEDINVVKFDYNKKDFIDKVLPKGTEIIVFKRYLSTEKNGKIIYNDSNSEIICIPPKDNYSEGKGKRYYNLSKYNLSNLIKENKSFQSMIENLDMNSRIMINDINVFLEECSDAKILLKELNDIDSYLELGASERYDTNKEEIYKMKLEVTIKDKNNKDYVKVKFKQTNVVDSNYNSSQKVEKEYFLYKNNKLIKSFVVSDPIN